MELTRILDSNKVLNLLFYWFSNTILLLLRFVNSFPKNRSGVVLITSFHKLGDTVFTIPAVKEIVNHYKGENVIILTFPECIPIYRIVFSEIKIESIDRKEFKFNSRIASFKAGRKLKKISPGIIIDITGSITSAFLIAQSHASKIIGLNQKFYKSIYSEYVPIRHVPDLMDRYLDVVSLIRTVKRTSEIKEFPVNYNKTEEIFLNPFGGWKAKEWNLSKFVKLAAALNREFYVKIVCMKGQIPESIIDEVEFHEIPILYTETVQDLINAIDRCALFIGNDTGPLYIANLKGKPTFAIFGPTSVKYPYSPGAFHRYIQKVIPCTPVETQYCFTNAGQLCPAYQCMDTLSLREVKSEVLQFIEDLGIKGKE